MTLQIHEQGGLLASEVDLRIEQATGQQVQTLEQKLREHQDAIERRLTATDNAVKDNLERTIELKANFAVLMASDKKQTELLESIAENGTKWHEADLDYRTSMIERVKAIETEQKRLSDQVKVIRWLVSVSGACVKALSFGLSMISTEDFWKWAGIAFTFWLLHFVSPYASHWLSGFLGH